MRIPGVWVQDRHEETGLPAPHSNERRNNGGIVQTLFPDHPPREEQTEQVNIEDIPLFPEQELNKATNSLRNNKESGLDCIPAEALKIVAANCPQLMLTCTTAVCVPEYSTKDGRQHV